MSGGNERLNALKKARREAAIAYHSAVGDLLTHIDAEVPQPAAPLIAACDAAHEIFLDYECAVNAEQFQLDMVKLIGRRGDQPPIASNEGRDD